MTRSLRNLEHQGFGFETDHRVSIVMNGPPASYTEASTRHALPRAAGAPALKSPEWHTAALALYTPFIDKWGELIVPEGHGMPQMDDNSTLLGPRQPRIP